MPPTRTLFAILALALTAAALPAAAQEEPAGRFDERIQVTEVLLDVLVTDGDGNVVVGLDEGDFIVEEKGQPVEVAAATFYGSSKLLDSPALAGRLEPTGAAAGDRFFILFFHDLRREAPSLLRRQRDATVQSRRWVEESLGERDWVAVVSYYAKLRIHQDFTRDRALALAALDSVARGEDPGATWSAAAQLGSEPSLTRHLDQGKELRRQTTRIEDGLKVLAEAAAQTRGRKNLVFFSIGFGEVDRFGWKPDQRYYPRTERALNDANVAVYAIALAGGAFTRDPVIEALGHSLSQLAADTGGRHFQTFANFAAPLEQVVEDNGGYYLLSYSAEYPAGDSGYREVSVRTKNPDLRVRAREGYLFGG
jgi:VWFA-related protein